MYQQNIQTEQHAEILVNFNSRRQSSPSQKVHVHQKEAKSSVVFEDVHSTRMY